MSFEYFKNIYKASTSEEIFGITEQINPQCPVVDEIISTIDREVDSIRSIKSAIERAKENDDLNYLVSDLDWVRFNLEQLDVEKLRTAIAMLRDWGKGWKDLCENIISENDIDVDKYSILTKK